MPHPDAHHPPPTHLPLPLYSFIGIDEPRGTATRPCQLLLESCGVLQHLLRSSSCLIRTRLRETWVSAAPTKVIQLSDTNALEGDMGVTAEDPVASDTRVSAESESAYIYGWGWRR
eukprot:scaffold13511_cov132-Isochrysis_galbana.AAC.5